MRLDNSYYTRVKAIYESPQQYADKEITLAGWVRTIRSSNAIAFIELNDGSCFKGIQLVMESDAPDFEKTIKQNVGAALIVTGTLVLTPEAKQPFELKVYEVTVEGESSTDYPLQKKRHSMEFLRTITHLRPRTNTLGAVFRVRSEASFAIHDFFHKNGFVYAHTPLITASDAEGAGQMFTVTTLDLENPPKTEQGRVDYSKDFFARPTYLTVTGQLEAEAFALAYGRTYTFGPTFRAERSNTPRHAAEFWMIEPEIAFADLNDNMAIAESVIKYVINHVLDSCPQELEFFNTFIDKGLIERLRHVADSSFAVLSYTDAIAELEKVKDRFEYPVYWGCDLQTEHERFLTEELIKRPVFVINYPKEIKAFYMRQNDDGKTVAAMDLLVPAIGELIGGSQREERLDKLENRIEELKLKKENYAWYLELRRFGGVYHSGFGIGFERLLMYLTGIQNIRDVSAFPRTTGNFNH